MIYKTFAFALLATISAVFGNSNAGKDAGKDIVLPYPFKPPPAEFCQTNFLGDDAYISVFLPCTFTFYSDADASIDHFNCSSILPGSRSRISTEQRKIYGWPESCVANGPRCYNLTDHPNLFNYTLVDDSEYAMKFPSGANVVSVDCSADYAKAEEVMKNIPQMLEPVAGVIALFAVTVFLIVAIGICMCCCCCIGGSRNRMQGYSTIPGVHHGPPVEANAIQGAYVEYQVPPYKATADV
mmetsp:Transcript_7701/g.11290  ORF Transcript_7701/g.11290 Transcript_7701/m.11290 type:complete len:240 (-) Transcript_7701:113-832(-)|eukprot:CAMPEP_0197249834 /NCGR_PEP_ID=MMETSP1429-20130617/49631_1 /TAXON_ID=49237 /ORGANISM="Chaetoceros  sp., Strain UNC1202" /LENGTH=239 /DNA_ID=CAMNT_0042711497 /DNA_START=58 /DNA_END=777 /DNA_ORIENTATION=+